MQNSTDSNNLKVGLRVHSVSDPTRIGTIKYIGNLAGHPGSWIGVDWDNADGKHDGSLNGVRYFDAKSQNSGSFIRPQSLSTGISFVQALKARYKPEFTQQHRDDMYVLSATNRRVAVELVGMDAIQDKLSRFEEMTGASLSYMGVANPGSSGEIKAVVPNLKDLDLTGNLISEWKDIGTISEQLPNLSALNLSYNLLSTDISGLPLLKNIRILVLNHTGLNWTQVEALKHFLPVIKELHLMGNGISTIEPTSSSVVRGFDFLRLLNLEDNNIVDWNEVRKLSLMQSLEQLHLNKNNLKHVFYPDQNAKHKLLSGLESDDKNTTPFENLRCLLLGGNDIQDLDSVDSLNLFPKLVDIRFSENPITDPGRGGIPRFVLIARLAKVEILNGGEVTRRERKESEIRYVRLVMSKLNGNSDQIKQLHPRFTELKEFHGIEDEKPSVITAGPVKMASGLLCTTAVTLKCIGPSIGEKPSLTKKLPASTTVGKLRSLCESFFKLKSVKPKLFLQEEGLPLPTLLDDEMANLMDVGVVNGSTILVDEE